MHNLLTAQLAVTNVCHELANWMSVMKFFQDDIIAEIRNGSLSMQTMGRFFDNLDACILSIDFFRNLYAPIGYQDKAISIVKKMYEQKDITIKEERIPCELNKVFKNIETERAIATILFLLLKIVVKAFNVKISYAKEEIRIDVFNCSKMAKDRLVEIFSSQSDCLASSPFNIVALYSKLLLAAKKVKIRVNSSMTDLLRIILCQK